MGKGLFLGLLTGSLVSVSGLSVVSLMAPPLGAADNATEAVDAMSDAAPVEPEQNVPEAVTETVESTEPVVAPDAMAESEPATVAEPAAGTELAMASDPADTQPEAPVVEAPAGSEFTRERPDEDPVLPAAEAAPASMDAPVVEAPAAETAPDLPEVTPAGLPEGQTAAPEMIPSPEISAPDALAEVPAAEQMVPVPPTAEAAAPELGPGVDADAALSLAPEPAPALPAIEAAEQAAPDAQPAMDMAEPLPAAEEETTEVDVTDVSPAEEPELSPEEEAAVEEESLPEVLAETETDGGDRKPTIIGIGVQPRIGSDAGPQPGFAGASGVRINRPPSISGDADQDPAAEAVAEPEISPDSGDLPAIQRYAVAVDNPDGLPLVGVVLTDPGSGGVPAEELAGIMRPVTVAIDPTRADAAERAAALRAAGLEIAILVPELPEGATASDMEVSYQSFTQTLPEAVAIIGAPDAPFQSDRRAAQHVVALLGSDGRGLITYDRGLNPARQAAESKDVPSAVVYRELDARGETRLTMLRYLDRAAFEAARTGQVLVVAEASVETVAALSDWVASGAKETMVAPVSAMMIQAGQ